MRNDHILSYARPHLEEGEEVAHWVRARHPEKRGAEGFMFVTSKRFVLCWTGSDLQPHALEWEEIEAWGVDDEARGGPVLFIERDHAPAVAQMPVTTDGMARTVSHFVREFARRAPEPVDPPQEDLWRGRFAPRADVSVAPESRSLTAQARRIVVTVIGILLVVGGTAIIPLPGPWSFPVIIAGLAVLASEYDWAKDVRDWVRERYKSARRMIRSRRARD
ncbi:MAG TPA: PGPGW domain-containing protein [Actinomycetota bacterium]|nr:PGPGW domain-containing protein [Actinomycetota bacterium]